MAEEAENKAIASTEKMIANLKKIKDWKRKNVSEDRNRLYGLQSVVPITTKEKGKEYPLRYEGRNEGKSRN